MIYAATREEVEVCRKAFLRKLRIKHRPVLNQPPWPDNTGA
jgi:hypothetical protein